MSHILRTAKKKVRDLPSTHLSVVNCASAGTLPAEAESLRPLQGRLNKTMECGVPRNTAIRNGTSREASKNTSSVPSSDNGSSGEAR